VVWVEAGWVLDAGNYYYIAIDTDAPATAVMQNSIAGMDRAAWGWNRFPGTLPFAEVAAFTHAGPGESGWDDVSSLVTNNSNYGLTVPLSAACDYTRLIVDQKSLFAHAIAKRVASNLMKEMAYNPKARINRQEANVDYDKVMYEVDGNTAGRPTGLNKE